MLKNNFCIHLPFTLLRTPMHQEIMKLALFLVFSNPVSKSCNEGKCNLVCPADRKYIYPVLWVEMPEELRGERADWLEVVVT